MPRRKGSSRPTPVDPRNPKRGRRGGTRRAPRGTSRGHLVLLPDELYHLVFSFLLEAAAFGRLMMSHSRFNVALKHAVDLWQKATVHKHGPQVRMSLRGIWCLEYCIHPRPAKRHFLGREGIWCAGYDPNEKVLYCAKEDAGVVGYRTNPLMNINAGDRSVGVNGVL